MRWPRAEQVLQRGKRHVQRWMSRRFGQLDTFVNRWRGGALRPWMLRLPVLGWRKIRLQLVRTHAKHFGRLPDLLRPRGINERVMQRMIHDRDPWLRFAGDKLATRKFVSRMVGPDYALPLLGSWRRGDRIEWEKLPNSFVLKPNNMSGKVQVVADLSSTDTLALAEQAVAWQHQSYFDVGLEWSYLNTPDRILAEPIIKSRDGGSLIEVNVNTFAGKPVIFEVLTGKKGTKRRCCVWFDAQGQRLQVRAKAAPPEEVLDEAAIVRLTREFNSHRRAIAELAQQLGRWFALMRVDIWITSEGLKVAELTAYPQRGTMAYQPAEWDQKLGALFVECVRDEPAQPWRRRTSWPRDIPAPGSSDSLAVRLQRFALWLRHWRWPKMPPLARPKVRLPRTCS